MSAISMDRRHRHTIPSSLTPDGADRSLDILPIRGYYEGKFSYLGLTKRKEDSSCGTRVEDTILGWF